MPATYGTVSQRAAQNRPATREENGVALSEPAESGPQSIPALLARKSRKRFGSPKFRVWGGKPMIALILVFGIGNAVVHVLSSFNLLPVYQ